MDKELYQNKYHSTGQMRNAIKHLQNKYKFKGFDEEGNPVYDNTTPLPKVVYEGTVKLHGTNGSVVLHENGDFTFHSKNNLLATYSQGEFTLLSDNAEFAQSLYRNILELREVFDCILDQCSEFKYPIKLSGEWCGPSVQNGVGISKLPNKKWFVYGVSFNGEWRTLYDLHTGNLMTKVIHNLNDYAVFEVEIDLNMPEVVVPSIEEWVNAVEAECPVAKAFDLGGELIGEGIVWTPVDPELRKDSGTWFKTKGQKHSVSKVKKVVSVDPEKLQNVLEFVEYAVTENRLSQGVQEVGADIKKMGEFIGWVNRDINKEEGDVLEANNLTMKDVGKYVSNKAREYYLKLV